jgi:hypothetical protein
VRVDAGVAAAQQQLAVGIDEQDPRDPRAHVAHDGAAAVQRAAGTP